MVGDRLDTDILFGNTGGFSSTLLVLTGVTSRADVKNLSTDDKRMPTHIVETLGDLSTWIS